MLCFSLLSLSSLAAIMATPPPTVPQTTLEIGTETPPQLQTNPMVAVVLAASSPFAVIQLQEYYRRFRRFVCMEVVRATIGLGVGALLVCAFQSSFLVSYHFSSNPYHLKLIVFFWSLQKNLCLFFRHIFSWKTRSSLLVEWECPSLTVD